MYISDKQKFTLLCQVGGSHVYVLDKQKFTLPCQVGEAMFLSVKQKFTLLCQMSGTVSQESHASDNQTLLRLCLVVKWKPCVTQTGD